MSPEKRRPVTSGAASDQSAATTTVIVTKRLAPWRQRRLQHLARRQLDELLGVHPDPWILFSEPIDWHDTHMDRSLQWRRYHGEQLRAARWVP